MKFKDSELSKERSIKNKANAAKNTQFHSLGPGGDAVGMPKWDKSEQEMEDAGVTPVTTLQESATLSSATADGKGKDGGRQRPLPSAADGNRLRQSRLR